MKSYEGLFIFPPDEATEARKNQLKNLEELFKKFGASVQQKTEWGKRPLGYPIKKHREGYFLLADYQMDPSRTTEFRKALELEDSLLKYMITVKPAVRAPKKTEAPQPAAVVKPPSRHPSSPDSQAVSSHSGR